MKRIVLFLLAALAIHAAVDLTAFNGAWKFNPDKSELAGDIMSFKQTTDGMFVSSAGVDETKFRMDGKDYPSPMGYTMAWTEAGKDRWTEVVKVQGNPVSNVLVELAPGGEFLTMSAETRKPDGEVAKQSVRYKRVAGTAGLIGAWESEKVQVPPETMVIKAAANEITISIPAWQQSATAKLDGKSYPLTGPTVPPGFTMSVRPIDSRTLEVREAKDGKVIEAYTLKLSEDGKTITEALTRPGQDRKSVIVLDKQ